jgi:hypothetical protein
VDPFGIRIRGGGGGGAVVDCGIGRIGEVS